MGRSEILMIHCHYTIHFTSGFFTQTQTKIEVRVARLVLILREAFVPLAILENKLLASSFLAFHGYS